MKYELLPDPVPVAWLPDPTQIMQSVDGAYGNFWADKPCEVPHLWLCLAEIRGNSMFEPRGIYRCQRCGSQLWYWVEYPLPESGKPQPPA